MASFSFKTLNIISLLLALSIFGITVAAACVTWYSSNDTYNQVTSASVVSQSNPKTVLNSTSYLYSLQGITTKTISNQRVAPLVHQVLEALARVQHPFPGGAGDDE